MTDQSHYIEDLLKDGFEQRSIQLDDDYEGRVIFTLIRRLSKIPSNKSVLYIHGFNDYFFQEELASKFNEQGFNFYAVDLRKYGRSLLPHQRFNDIRDLRDYFDEISEALNIIREEGNRKVILLGHSTGGLIATLYAKDYSEKKYFDGLILNSPFFEFNKNKIVKILIPFTAFLGKIFPRIKVPGGFTKEYGKSLHTAYYGEWEYEVDWKPDVPPKVNIGWIRAIYNAQKELKKTVDIQQPVLVMHSAQSVSNDKNKQQMQTMDAILNVKDIDEIAHNINGDVEIDSIEGGLHDLFLSQKPVRENVYSIMFNWIRKHTLI